MTILFLDQFNQPGGAQQCLLDLLPAVLERGWKAVVMLPGAGVLGDTIRRMGVEVLPVACGPYASGHKTASDLARFVRDVGAAAQQIAACRKRRRADVIYVNGPRLVPSAVLGSAQTPIVFHCHSLLAPKYLEWLTAIPLRMAKASVIASSSFVAGPLRRWIPAGLLQVIYNGVRGGDSRTFRPTGLRIGIVGRIAPEKGQDTFLRAARILAERIPACEFVVCGAPLFSDSSYEAEIRKLADGLPVAFTGWREDVSAMLDSMDLLVVPSAPADATPRIIPQAFAAGLPVVAFANEGFRELIDDGRTGFLIACRTAEALAKKIEEVLKGHERDAVAQAARHEWQTRFTVEAYRENVINALELFA